MENPADWKSTVDQTTGRTYWYHRKTRVSTWTKPDFLSETAPAQTSATSVSTVANNNGTTSTASSVIATNPTVPSSSSGQVSALSSLAAVPSAALSVPYTNNSTSSNTAKITTTTTSRIPLPQSSSNDFRFQVSPDDHVNVEQLKYLQRALDTQPAAALSVRKSPQILTDLVTFLATCRHRSSRLQALNLLWKLSVHRMLASTAFQGNQAWINLWAAVERWEDQESFVLLAACFCNLSIGPTYDLIPLEAIEQLCGKAMFLLDSLLSLDKKLLASATLSIDDLQLLVHDLPLKWYALMAQKGHVLPSLVVLILASQALRQEKAFIALVKFGMLPAMVTIATSPALDEVIRERAQLCLRSYMSCSTYARERLLDGFLQMTFDLNQIAMPTGTHPSFYSCDQESDEDMCQALLESGCYDVHDNTPGEVLFNQSLANRDIEWIPKSGTSWRLSSSILWSRCPALREIIQDFWNQGGGCLELSIDASDEVVASVCHYVHHGLLTLPVLTLQQLELLRVSSELGMFAFQHTVEEAIEQLLTRDNIEAIADFCESFGFSTLLRACASFLQTGKVSNHIRLQVGTDGNPNNVSLKNAIYESLQDVSELLMKAPANNNNNTNKSSNVSKPVTAEPAPASFNYGQPSYPNVSSSTLPTAEDYSYQEHDETFGETDDSYRFELDADLYLDESQPSVHPTSSKGGKLKSGGIYSLLLKGQKGAGAVDTGVKPLRNDQMPGKLMEKGKPHTAAKHKHAVDHSFDMPQEYNQDMSLKPSKPKSEQKKRLDEISKPKHSKEPTMKKGHKEGKDDDGDDSSNEDTAAPIAAPAKGPTKSAAKPASKASAKPNATSQEKIKVNPVKVSSSENSLSIAGNVKPTLDTKIVGGQDETERPPQNTVRSSLTLLKNRGPRRRASIANNQPLQDDDLSPTSQHESAQNSFRSAPSSSQFNNLRESEDFDDSQDNSFSNHQQRPPSQSNYKPQNSFKSRPEESYQEEEEEEPDHHGEDYGEDSDEAEGQDRFNGASGYQDFEDDPNAANQAAENTMECPDCGRHFLPEPFSRHIKICKKVFASKRKVFDMSKKRIEGIPELKSLLDNKKRVGGIKKQSSQSANAATAARSKWKEQSSAFREAMRAARNYSSGQDDGMVMDKPKTPYIDPSLIQCPNCQRRFNDKAAERHIPLCKNIIAKPSTLKKGSGVQASTAVGAATPTTKTSTVKRGWN